MRQLYMGQWVRMALALAAVLLVAGPGLVLAAGPSPTYVPKSSVLIGPTTVSVGQSAQYTLRVTFINNQTLDFPQTMGATFAATSGAFNSTPGLYTAPNTAMKARITGSFIENGAKVNSSLVITITP